jgi:hypothetical protein
MMSGVGDRGAGIRGTAVAVIGTVAVVAAILVLPVVLVAVMVLRAVDDGGPPTCDREPVLLEWIDQDGAWFRTTPFELETDEQTVQIDVTLRPDGGVIRVGQTVYVARAGGPFPDVAEVGSTTGPFDGVVVGRGVDAVNEQVDLGPGAWELMVRGGAAPAEVRWPC